MECWGWAGYCNRDGYAKMRVGTTMVSAHRVSYELHYGLIPADACVLHACDNPPCCNPAHLYLGTQADNAADRERRGRNRGLAVIRARAGESP